MASEIVETKAIEQVSDTAVTRMMKVARFYSDEEMFATVSQTLTWSHFFGTRYHS